MPSTRQRRATPLALLLLALLLVGGSRAAAADPPPALVVAAVSAPPFAIVDAEGRWTGIAVALWQHVAADLGVTYTVKTAPIGALLTGLDDGSLAVVLTAVASAERERQMDFSHPYYSSGLAIAVPAGPATGGWLSPLANLASWATLKLVLVLGTLTVIAATLVWLLERRHNPEQFRRSFAGLVDALWWAMVTLCTVGYGDKSPKSGGGRLIASAWMLTAIILIALFTAQVTSSLTVTSLSGRIRGPGDLAGVRVGTLAESQQQAVLRSHLGIHATGFAGFGRGLEALVQGEIDAFVGPEPILRYEIATAYAGRLTVVGPPFLRIDYVFALPLGSPMRKEINESILSFIETEDWRQLLRTYLGGA